MPNKPGTVFWFTGLSGAGKSTISQAVKPLLEARGHKVLILDGDEVRRRVTSFDFSEQGIKRNLAVVAQMALEGRAEHDVVFVAVISPFAESRRNARALLGEGFYEIYFCADLETVVRRDTKGLYAKAKANVITNMVGFSPGAVYEPPQNPDFVIDSAKEVVSQSTDRFFNFIISKVPPPQDPSSAFLREYVDLIGALSAANNSRLWWATDIASKNRFNSRLPLLLQKAMEGAPAPRRDLKAWTSACRKFLAVFYHALIFIGRMGYARLYLHNPVKAHWAGKEYYVVKTFIYDHSFTKDGAYTDNFFGSLPQTLNKRQPVLVLGHILGNYRQCVRKIKDGRDFVILPVEYFVSLGDVVAAVRDILAFKPNVSQELKFFGRPVASIISAELFRTYKGIQIYQLLHYAATRRLLKAVRVSAFLLTHENNPWEKMCIMALREHSPGTRIMGYQHTIVCQASVNMFISRLEENIAPRPDRVLTVGAKPKEIIHRYETCRPSAIAPACGLRFEHLFRTPQSQRAKRGNVLLALEGLPQAAEMVNYVLGQWPSCAQYRLRIRTHPVLPLSKFKHQLAHDPERMPRVAISRTVSLQEDIAWADIVIYWGSTVALEALSMGKPVVHYDNGSVLSYDPLFELADFKWRVRAPQSLAATLEEIARLSDQEYASCRQAARDYIAQYFHPVTPEAMDVFL